MAASCCPTACTGCWVCPAAAFTSSTPFSSPTSRASTSPTASCWCCRHCASACRSSAWLLITQRVVSSCSCRKASSFATVSAALASSDAHRLQQAVAEGNQEQRVNRQISAGGRGEGEVQQLRMASPWACQLARPSKQHAGAWRHWAAAAAAGQSIGQPVGPPVRSHALEVSAGLATLPHCLRLPAHDAGGCAWVERQRQRQCHAEQ